MRANPSALKAKRVFMLLDERGGDDRTDVAAGRFDRERLDKRASRGVEDFRRLQPRVHADVDDVLLLQFKVRRLAREDGGGIHDKGFRLVQRAANDEHAALEGLEAETAARGDGADDGGL